MDCSLRFIGAAGVVCVALPASAQVYDFNTLVHGEIITNQFEPALSITGTNPNRAFDIIAGFDTTPRQKAKNAPAAEAVKTARQALEDRA